MKSPKFVALVLLCALLSFAMPAAADELTIDALAAAQYSYGYFIAYVSAHGPAPIIDAHVLVNGVVVVPDRVDQHIYGPSNNFGVWTIYKYANGVARPGDVVTAVVTDMTLLPPATKTVAC